MKVPEPRLLPSGKWFIQLRIKGKSVCFTEDDVEACRAKAHAYKADVMPESETVKITLRKAIDKYIDGRSNILSPSTIRGYRSMQKNRLCDVMDKPLSTIKDWPGIINREAAGISAKYLKNIWGLVRPVLAANGIKTKNEIQLPKVISNERPWLTPKQIQQFLPLVHGKRYEIAALLALHGLRRSEIYALTWDKIDLDKRLITVAGSRVLDENHKLVDKKANKTSKSRRIVPIMIPALYDALTAVDNKAGRVVDRGIDRLYENVNYLCRKNGLPQVGAHGLRHSFASLGYHLHMTEMEVMEIGGWDDFETVHKIYTHLAREDRLEGENKMKEFYQAISNQNAN
jgi:Site-specific recombinase XerC